MSDITASDRRTHERSTNVPWFGFLAVGAAFALFALAIPQFDLTTVWSIAVLLGIVLLLGAVSELLAAAATARDWRWSHALLAVLFVAGGVVALVWPDPTVKAVGRIAAWFFLIKGLYDVVNSFVARRTEQQAAAGQYATAAEGRPTPAQWWMPLIVGALEIGAAFWVVGSQRVSLPLLALWVGLTALAIGLTKIAMGFRLRGVSRPPASLEGLAIPGFGAGAVEGRRLEEGRVQRPVSGNR
ncbi:hypothetical protein CcI156_04950 [Frankia sp. CcI156]|uniref:DUF308 domain-containing protein n=1 Tax=Frankia casuarinae (strain DSM 45818 / CECT 9043 / HFP020203 / CcI3) TaxID=106370 RepID=Q2JCM2_FRACC|nr:hypothetical protein Francci3_1594 [Frankia casuarinae]ETA02178.1 hypothetical protein CcI6DRAFT_02353 [Frankia sp. CcI6]KDA42861.1 hypothetical protein BMG523Draft_02250 [Frankia sp. BMG5.23]KEZ37512.1 hypothetical protein CEDDRAFT_01139 [Frankia sp. CeD]OHV57794.1 hypothetical protein CgIS1_01320 [Frankia sp. CgIS1]ONH28558.1 hypothetical protein CcI156_04950 [Frankia sp. CcI156]ORT52342.1 hypothetical protein KBI5_10100 [Frankia sp. KB5]TFE30456.1 DUF308 domain-containing protein [Fran